MDLVIENLKKVYNDKVALDIEHLEIGSGQLVGLVGNNGAGKTTLLRLILDLIRADSGRVLSNGMDVTGAAEGRSATFTAADNIEWKRYTGSFIDSKFPRNTLIS